MTDELVDLAAIEQLAQYVSDGRWSAEAGVVRAWDGADFPEIATAERAADAEWIAFFDPPTIRKLVDELHVARELIHDVGLSHLLADGAAQRGQL